VERGKEEERSSKLNKKSGYPKRYQRLK